MPFRRPSINAEPDIKDQELLAEQGYKQELKRDWSVIHNFGVSFSIISVIVRMVQSILKIKTLIVEALHRQA